MSEIRKLFYSSSRYVFRRAAALLLYALLAAALFFPAAVSAEGSGKVVRVGWYESSFNTTDKQGRRSGYAYEYQLKLAAYTGWTFEYVKGSWSDLLQMLIDGELDLMSDVSYTKEREGHMLFSTLPMGTEEYYLFVAPGNQAVNEADCSTLNGKKIGANKGSVQADYYREWAAKNGVNAELIELTCDEGESLKMLEDGRLDAYVTVDSFTNPELAVPVYKIGSSDFYFAVRSDGRELLDELNAAMYRIQSENRFYNQEMFEKHFKRTGANVYLPAEEVKWLSEHGTIRVGYQDDYLAFCAADKETGELTGLLKDCLDYASGCVANTELYFEPVCYPTAASALEALKMGEVDCVFPSNLSGYDGEVQGVLMTPELMETEVYAIVRQSDGDFFSNREHVIVAVNEGNPNYDSFLIDHYPDWTKVYFPNTEECLKAVSAGVADCVLISNFRYNNIARLCERYRLTTYTTGLGVEYCFAVNQGSSLLYSILARTIGLIPTTALNSALSYYITKDAKLTLMDFIVDHLGTVLAVIAVVLLVILFFMVRSMQAERRSRELIAATENDALTGLYNRDFFFQYANRMYRDHHDTPMDAIVLNIDQFHSVNMLNGRDFGDQVLRLLGDEISLIAKEYGGIAGRFEADRFDIYCRHTEDYQAIFDRLQSKLDTLAPNANVRLRMGVMPWQEKLEPVELFDRARTACSMARGHYKEHLIVFDETVRKREIYEQRLLNDLRHALEHYEFEVYYQPKYDIRSDPPKLVSAEALVRWRHPELGMIPPSDFIPLLEKNGQISMVDKYVWSEAARQIVRWKEQYGVTIPVSVNLSRVDVFDPALEDTLDEILRYNGLDYPTLKLEVTESAYTENADQVIHVVESLRSKGYVVEMDDFGTGYSSLNMLSAMPVDVIKMDRAFIRNIDHEEKDIQLVALILGIANNLRIPVIAEGVETEEQIKLLKGLGCTLVQGYYFSKPLHAEDFEAAFIKQ